MSGARWLSLAAMPACAVMALHSAVQGSAADMLCSAAGTSPLGGMTAMWVLMSVIHAPPWIRLASQRERQAGPQQSTARSPTIDRP
ncbi:hypothetical protein LZK98_01430 [Sphingomonas cannabina]|uniref:hypothetical protein n=1 Tax=Sphingomonas cannabina TaxID=2899123 RepID=UPI001F464933|nr:hypothetical protein [Sphingomonas cannabina]UIJ45652.1 hypothetical protein LZK98_01430 [Sphingomonas cannabina]